MVEKGTCLYCDMTSRGKRVTGNFKKKNIAICGYEETETQFLPWVPQASHGDIILQVRLEGCLRKILKFSWKLKKRAARVLLVTLIEELWGTL